MGAAAIAAVTPRRSPPMTPADRPDLSDETFHLDLKPGPDPLADRGVRRVPIYRLKRALKYLAREAGFRVSWGRPNPPCELAEREFDGGPMIRFTDGPAAGKMLLLRRAPLYLRVVFDTIRQRWDALDQLADTPGAGDVVFVYRRTGTPHAAFIDWTERGKRVGRCVPVASYAVCAEQPADAAVRDTAAWREWCRAEVKKTPEEKPCGPDSSAVASASAASPSNPSAPSAASAPSAKSTSGSAGGSRSSS
jgi:hypothetical protein